VGDRRLSSRRKFGGTAKKRRKTAKALAVDEAVLDRLSALTARWDPSVARKVGGDQTPLTSAEMTWMAQAVVRLVFTRVGEVPAGAPLAQIAFTDLPLLE
jgi:hypothetical protein